MSHPDGVEGVGLVLVRDSVRWDGCETVSEAMVFRENSNGKGGFVGRQMECRTPPEPVMRGTEE
jgi:hypothetical protein